jgi:hypothetical protein
MNAASCVDLSTKYCLAIFGLSDSIVSISFRAHKIVAADRIAFILDDNGENPVAGLDGLLGVVSLKSRRVGFDPARKILGWDQFSNPGKP